MRKEIIFEMSSPYRDTFRIQGYWFGTGEPSLAIVGPMRGDEAQQQYICATMVNDLQRIERRGEIEPGKSILVIPTCNPFSLNVNHRFWSMDGTDINRMFPGYDRGETTQRIAAAIFDKIKSFKYGIQLASFYVPGDFIPHVRMLKTGYEDIDGARLFGLPYITIREPLPFDTTLLNYNWQIWETKAFSLYSGHTETIDEDAALISREAMLRFMGKTGINSSFFMLSFRMFWMFRNFRNLWKPRNIRNPPDQISSRQVLIIKKTGNPCIHLLGQVRMRALGLSISVLFCLYKCGYARASC